MSELRAASSPVTGSGKAYQRRMAGVWPSLGVAALSAGVTIACLAQASAVSRSVPGEVTLALVDSADVDAALTTLSLPPAIRTRFEKRDGTCPLPLAWVQVTPTSLQANTSVRFVSGDYYSPVFPLGKSSVRIAIPYPAAYETGRGMLSIMHTGGDISVALTPTLAMPASMPTTTRVVTWSPVQRCTLPGG